MVILLSNYSEYLFPGSETVKTQNFLAQRQPWSLRGKMTILKNSVYKKALDTTQSFFCQSAVTTGTKVTGNFLLWNGHSSIGPSFGPFLWIFHTC